MPDNPRPALSHPDTADLTIYAVLHGLSDPTRLVIVGTLRRESGRACGTFPVHVAPSTLTHHFRVLREAGVIRQRDEGNRRWTTLRLDDLESRFPGLIDSVLSVADLPRTHTTSQSLSCVEPAADVVSVDVLAHRR